ncbi:hypothetical protein [Salinarimonas rosea]|uniref:hypothetical protein n=1 Tax=Salinarimonas rosea TaxID=552063 RepID=UPI00041EE0E7|nr:hypothetical protein [Salinarimonas rosea]
MTKTRIAIGLLLAAPLLAGCGTSERKLFRAAPVIVASPLAEPLRPIPPGPAVPAAPPALAVTPTSVRIETPREPARPASVPGARPEAEAATVVLRPTPGILVERQPQVLVPRAGDAPARAAPASPRPAPVAARPDLRPAVSVRTGAPARTDTAGTRIRRSEGNGWEVL